RRKSTEPPRYAQGVWSLLRPRLPPQESHPVKHALLALGAFAALALTAGTADAHPPGYGYGYPGYGYYPGGYYGRPVVVTPVYRPVVVSPFYPSYGYGYGYGFGNSYRPGVVIGGGFGSGYPGYGCGYGYPGYGYSRPW